MLLRLMQLRLTPRCKFWKWERKMLLLTKSEEQDLIKVLVDNQTQPELAAVRRLVEHRLEEAKVKLVECQVSDLQRFQGLAATYASLLRDLTRPKPSIAPKE